MKIHLWLMISTRINKDLDQKYSYKVETTTPYKRLANILMADYNTVYRAILCEQDAKDFESQNNPNFKGVFRSKPVEHFKVVKKDSPTGLDSIIFQRSKLRIKRKKGKINQTAGQLSKDIQKELKIK